MNKYEPKTTQTRETIFEHLFNKIQRMNDGGKHVYITRNEKNLLLDMLEHYKTHPNFVNIMKTELNGKRHLLYRCIHCAMPHKLYKEANNHAKFMGHRVKVIV